ncbi:hypothetical protein BH23ACI1_BH23ACI1_27100 [soil metagenome]
MGDTPHPAKGVLDGAPPGLDAGADTPHAPVAELARACRRIDALERHCDFVTVHARNLELELRRLRREKRESAADRPRFEPDEGFWRRRYEEVTESLSWRLMWWIGTPYRAWVEFRGRSRS